MKSYFSLPELVVEVNGIPLEAQALRGLEEVRAARRLSLPSQIELTFSDPPGPLDFVSRMGIGMSLRVSMHVQTDPIFSGEITGIEYRYGPSHEREVRVRGYDRLHRLRKRQSVRALVQMSLVDLARELVSDLGISVQGFSPTVEWQRIIQYRQNDLELLTDMAQRCGAYFILQEDGLHLLTLEGEGSLNHLTLGNNLLEARADMNAEPARGKVTVDGWDPLSAMTYAGETGSPRTGRMILAGASPNLFDENGTVSLTNELVSDDNQAEALAQAVSDTRSAREVTLWGVAQGDPRLVPGAQVAVAGLEASLDGQYVLTQVTHRINPREGFVSEFSTEPPDLMERPSGSIVTLGLVTSLDDPESAGRVQVHLPTYGDVETGWMGVLCAGAGESKGMVLLPDVGDQVMVLFPREDPANGFILGGLYGVKGIYDSGVDKNSVLRYSLKTRGGLKFLLDDEHHAIHLEDSTGSSIDFSPEKVFLHAAVDLNLEAPGHNVVIRGKAIDFQRG